MLTIYWKREFADSRRLMNAAWVVCTIASKVLL